MRSTTYRVTKKCGRRGNSSASEEKSTVPIENIEERKRPFDDWSIAQSFDKCAKGKTTNEVNDGWLSWLESTGNNHYNPPDTQHLLNGIGMLLNIPDISCIDTKKYTNIVSCLVDLRMAIGNWLRTPPIL